MPFVGKELDRLGLGSRWDQFTNSCPLTHNHGPSWLKKGLEKLWVMQARTRKLGFSCHRI